MSLQFNLEKTDAAPIQFNLNKRSKFIVEVYWDTPHDLDIHMFILTNGKIAGQQDFISYCNESLVHVDNPSVLHKASDKNIPFMNITGSVKHMGDARTGINLDARKPDEICELDVSLLSPSQNEIALFIAGYPQNSVYFRDVKDCKVVVKDDTGAELFTANLTSEFDQFTGVQMGSFIIGQSGWEFKPVAIGFNNGLGDIIGAYS